MTTILQKIDPKSTLLLLVGMLINLAQVLHAQTAVTSYNTTVVATAPVSTVNGLNGYNTTSSSTNFFNPTNTYNVHFGITYPAAGANQNIVSGFVAGGFNYTKIAAGASAPYSNVNIRRVNNAAFSGNRFSGFFEYSSVRNSSSIDNYNVNSNNSSSVYLKPSAQYTMADMINNFSLSYGADNIFSNIGQGNIGSQTNTFSTGNNIERVDLVYAPGIGATSASGLQQLGFLINDRGGNDNFKVAAITSIDAFGNVTGIGSVISVSSTSWGAVGPAVSTVVFMGAEGVGNIKPKELIGMATITAPPPSSQPVGGIYFSLSALGIPVNTRTYGIVVFPGDITSNYLSLSGTPNNTFDAGDGGLDLMSANMMTRVTTNFDILAQTLSGKIWNDVNGNGLSTGEANVSGTNISSGGSVTTGGNLYVNIVDASTGNVIAVVQVQADGAYVYNGMLPSFNYKLIVTSLPGTIGSPISPNAPSGWINTNENLNGTIDNNSTTTLGEIAFTSPYGATNVTNQDFGITPAGYIYVQKKALDETSSINFPFAVSGGSTLVPNFNLNDKDDQIALRDIGASQNGRLYAVGTGGGLYYRDLGASLWVQVAGVTNATRVDGGVANTAYVINGGNVSFYNGTTVTTIYSGNNAIDVGNAWNNQPYIIATNRVYQYSGSGSGGTLGTAPWLQIGASANNLRIDGNPSNGNAVVTKTDNNIWTITSAGVATDLGQAAGTTSVSEVAVTSTGGIFATWAVTALNNNYYAVKWAGGTNWSAPELTSREYTNAAMTAGLGEQVWGVYTGGNTVGLNLNINTRTFDGTTALWLNDERVRTAVAGNSEMIAIVPGTYTIAELVPANWDLQQVNVYDPTNNSSTSLIANTATVVVAGGETVTAFFENGLISPFTMTNSCTNAYVDSFGTGASGTYGPALIGQTSYHYQTTGNTLANNYKIYANSNTLFAGAPSLLDHTRGDGLGRMFIVDANNEQDAFFRRRFVGIIPGATYNFSAWIANINAGAIIKPNVTFEVINPITYSIIAAVTTGAIITDRIWTEYGVMFTAPTGITEFDLVIRNNALGGEGNDLAIDDISFALAPPAPPATIVINSSCTNPLGSITVISPIGASYEYSRDATNWQTTTSFQNLPPGIYTIYTRLASVSGTVNCISSKNDTVKAAVCGNVYNDANGLTDNTVFGSPTSISGSLIAVLYDNSTGKVVDTAYVLTDGTFTMHAAIGDNYSIYLSSTPATIGQAATPTVTLPSDWVNTGEKLGTGTGSDGTPNGILPIGIISTTTTNSNFGVEQRPETNDQLLNITKNVIAGTVYSFPSLINYSSDATIPQLSGSDPEDKPASPTDSISSGGTFVITTLPPATQAILYYSGTPIGAGVVITNYDPAKLQIEFKSGTMTTTFQYALTDAAGMRDLSPATYQINLLGLLPATGLTLSTHKVNENLQLKWQTLTEDNTAYFNVEQSTDGVNYTIIGTVQAAGNSNTVQEYSFTHTMQNLAATYFRVSLKNKDGEISYSNVIRIGILNNLALNPNPAGSNVVISGLMGKNNISIYGIDGKQLQLLQATGPIKIIDMSNLAKGMYWVKISQQGQTIKIFKLIRE